MHFLGSALPPPIKVRRSELLEESVFIRVHLWFNESFQLSSAFAQRR